MSRSGYSEDCGGWELIRWRGAVSSAIRGKRGQATLREILEALDAMPIKALAAESLVTTSGEFCTLGALGAKRGVEMGGIDAEDRGGIASTFGIAEALAAEIMFENDEGNGYWREPETPEARWLRMRTWVASQIAATGSTK